MASTTPSAAGSSSTPSNPFAANEEFHKYYEKLFKLLKERKPEDKPRIVVYTDIEQDYDDLLTVIFLAEMHRMGAIELTGFVANHHPALQRAKFLRTVLHLLNLSHIPVAVGTAGVQGVEEILSTDDEDTKKAKIRKTKEALKLHAPDFYYGLKNTTFRDAPWNKDDFPLGIALVDGLADSKRPLTVLLISTLQDIGEYFDSHKTDPNFLRTRFSKFVSQGGYEVTQTNGKMAMTPVKDMMNNKFHLNQAANYTNYLANLKLRSDAWSREAAKASKLPGTFMKDLFQYGPIGAHLEWMWMRLEFKFYWDPFNWPFMPNLDPGWYLNTRLGMPRGTDQFNKLKDSAVPFTYAAPNIQVIVYDCCAAVGAVGDDFMRAMGVLVPENEIPAYNRAAHGHRVFGKDAKEPALGGVRGPVLREVMQAFIMGGLRSTYKKAQATPGFQKIQHDTTSYRFGVDAFLNDLLPLLKAEAAHLSNAQQYTKDASKAEEEGKKADAQRLLGLAAKEKKEAAELCQKLLRVSKTDMKNRPTRDDIPYEALYQKAMQSIGQGKRPAGGAGGK